MTTPGSKPADEATPKSRPRWRRILKRVIISLVIIVIVLVFGVFPWGLAALVTGARTRPMDRGLTETPASFGVQFKDIEFQASDGVKISGWLVPSGGRHATIIYSHGLFRSRRELLERAMDLSKRSVWPDANVTCLTSIIPAILRPCGTWSRSPHSPVG